MDMDEPAKVTTTAIVLRQANTALILTPRVNQRHVKHHPCHYRHTSRQAGNNDYPVTADSYGARHYHHHHHHRHEHHGHAMPHQSANSALSTQEALLSTNIAGLAATELGFLAISLALSILLLLIGYKIGDRVCKYEFLRNRDRGRGHKSSLAHRQQAALPLSDEKQPIYLEDDVCVQQHHDEPEPGPDALQVVTEPRAAWTYK
ncbi:hypothetical protein GGF44_006334 [Coemansia sp. RSA 1694]|nr:hypothetical protein IWW47_003852 [Coemansia sp. RSA 2052]KAJ2608946.1 hypothetical protein GGF44_006334 [Coemansia sp. RSA 1694]